MNTKSTSRKTKVSPHGAAGKRTATASKVRPAAKTVSSHARKQTARNLIKVSMPAADVESKGGVASVRDSKQARLITLLSTRPGATISQMMKLTGWQAHTVRGTISRVLRKKLKLVVSCKTSNSSGEHLYRIDGTASVA